MERSFAFRSDIDLKDYVQTVLGWHQVEMLLLFDLSGAGVNIYHSRILRKLESIIRDEYLLELFASFLAMPILLREGTRYSISVKGIPPASDLAPLLMNFYLDELDHAFEAQFPNFLYSRYFVEGFIFPGQSKDFDLRLFQKLFSQI